MRRFAEEVAPAVRALVEAERGTAALPRRRRAPRCRRRPAAAPGLPPPPAAAPAAAAAAAPLQVAPTPDDGTRHSAQVPWDESSRPTGPAPDPGRRYTPEEQAAGRHLVDVHDGLRAELTQLRDLVEQVAAGTLEAGVARSFINTMTLRQNDWTLGPTARATAGSSPGTTRWRTPACSRTCAAPTPSWRRSSTGSRRSTT